MTAGATIRSRYDPFAHAEQLGVRIRYDDRLPPGELGAWVSVTRTIHLRPDLTALLTRCTLAHELGHAVHDHRGRSAAQERAADRFAIEHLVTLDAVVDQVRASPDPGRWALELGVTHRLLQVYLEDHRQEIEHALTPA